VIRALTEPLSLTSQFGFCSLPLRLDSYRGCGFGCTYCFALQRGGNVAASNIAPADPSAVARALSRASRGEPTQSPVIEMLRRQVPIHFGGMSDPFQPAERKYRVSMEYLKALAASSYPVVISTKGTLIGQPEYRDLIRSIGRVVIQFSFSSVSDQVAKKVEPSATPPSKLLKVMESLASEGFQTTCRWQPYICGLSSDPSVFVAAMARAGARHLAFEHLKVPAEQLPYSGPTKRSAILSEQRASYRAAGAKRDGREFVLPAERKFARMTEVRDRCHDAGISFGAADNEFQYLSDFEACCSGVDQFPGFDNVFRYNIGCAVRRGRNSTIRHELIGEEWRPNSSVDRYLNSRSRLGQRLGVKGTIEDHLRYRWNAPTVDGSPSSTFFGVQPTSQRDVDGYVIYEWISRGDTHDRFESICAR